MLLTQSKKPSLPSPYGWLSKIGPFLGTLNMRFRIIKWNPKRDHNFGGCQNYGPLFGSLL